MNGLFEAFRFLTVLPFGKSRPNESLSHTLPFFPFVGIVLGIILFLINRILSGVFPSSVLNILILLILALSSGALHLDGLADTIDSFYAGKNKEEILNLMRDSHIGTMGVAALIFLILIKFLLLENIVGSAKDYTLIVMPACGRWAMVMAVALSRPARENGVGRLFFVGFRPRHWVVATLIFTILSLYLFKLRAIYLLSGTFIVTVILTWFIKRKIQGMTGDTFGAINEIIELTCLFILLFLQRSFLLS